jgi:hypothetical protein
MKQNFVINAKTVQIQYEIFRYELDTLGNIQQLEVRLSALKEVEDYGIVQAYTLKYLMAFFVLYRELGVVNEHVLGEFFIVVVEYTHYLFSTYDQIQNTREEDVLLKLKVIVVNGNQIQKLHHGREHVVCFVPEFYVEAFLQEVG